ncbi:MAG TPA: protein kinase [Acidobacteriaceae bacterium]|nr:protein kinase [Acidobacteriaceae bacterium]
MPLSQGSLLGEYEILSPVGAGGMGEVYRARDPRLNREVAIKVLPEFYSHDPNRLHRFEQEARAAAALNHPNILAVYQLGTATGGIVYIVSELLEGETVRERVRRGPVPLRSAIDWGVQIARGLAAAHKKGIIHRDLKPENLFITRDGHAKILDFGLARMEAPVEERDTMAPWHKTMPGVQMGTVGYMSPEQVRGETADERSDIFSFCVVLREMLTGMPTFEKPTSVEVMTAILNEYPVSQLGPNIPIGLQRVLERGLEKNPEQRFQSASDLAFALDSLSDGSMMSPGMATGLRLVPGTGGRRRSARTMGMIAGAVVTAALIAIALYVLARGPEPPLAANYVQLTNDGLQKALIGTDGARIYLSLTTSAVNNLAVLDIAAHEVSPMALPAANMQPVNVSPDGSTFLVIQGSGFPFRGALWSVPVLGGSPRRLGDAFGNAGAWSADRKRLAYADGANLYIAEADGANPRKIASSDRQIDSIAWTPDGTHLRLSESQGFGAAIGAHSIWEITSDGSGLHQVLAGWHNPSDECCGIWTPDGRFYLFQSGGQIWALGRESRVFHQHVSPVALTASPMTLSSPVVSKDGTKLFVVGATYRGELMRYDPRTRQFAPFLDGVSGEYVSFSKDGQWVAWVTYPDGALWRSRIDGTDRLQLTSPPMHPALPRWSPDGKTVAFFTFPQSATQPARMYEVPAEGGSPTELLPNDKHNQQDPNWSPDGTRIVFSGDQNDAASEADKPTFRILDLATRQVSFVPGSAGLFSPRWSPDGKFLVGMKADSRMLMLYSFATQKWTKLAEGNFGWVNYSSDGKYLYSLDFTGNGEVVRVSVADGKIEKIADLKGFVTTGQYGGSLSLTPHDEPLLLRDRGTQDVYALDFTER